MLCAYRVSALKTFAGATGWWLTPCATGGVQKERDEEYWHVRTVHREGISAVADGTILMGFLDQCSFFLLEPAEDKKIRFT